MQRRYNTIGRTPRLSSDRSLSVTLLENPWLQQVMQGCCSLQTQRMVAKIAWADVGPYDRRETANKGLTTPTSNPHMIAQQVRGRPAAGFRVVNSRNAMQIGLMWLNVVSRSWLGFSSGDGTFQPPTSMIKSTFVIFHLASVAFAKPPDCIRKELHTARSLVDFDRACETPRHTIARED